VVVRDHWAFSVVNERFSSAASDEACLGKSFQGRLSDFKDIFWVYGPIADGMNSVVVE